MRDIKTADKPIEAIPLLLHGTTRGRKLEGPPTKGTSSVWALIGQSRASVAYIRKGARFWRMRDESVREIAQVTGFSKDGRGIPHICYNVTFRRPHATHTERDDGRVLALDAFVRMFRSIDSPDSPLS